MNAEVITKPTEYLRVLAESIRTVTTEDEHDADQAALADIFDAAADVFTAPGQTPTEVRLLLWRICTLARLMITEVLASDGDHA